MILDSSAIVAIILKEPGYDLILQKIIKARQAGVGAPTLVECTIVISSRLSLDARGKLARFLDELNITVMPFTEVHYGTAIGAWLKYGKGRHPASLNFGDCITYAIAIVSGLPLLFLGDDFSKTDITTA
jgi:ribonuclease VapC